jgi:hypothetical protein
MTIPDLPEPESPHMDTRMLEFVERRREEQAHARRQRIQLVAIIALGLTCIILTVSNAVLVSRLFARPATPSAVAPPVRSAAPVTPAAPESDAGAPAAAIRSEPPPPAPTSPRAARTPAPRAAAVSTPAQAVVPVDDQPALPDRPAAIASRPVVPESSRPLPPAERLSPAVESDPAVRTARWMLRTYGPLEAETKALAAAQFYTGGEGEFWRRVVAHVRAER